MIPTRNLRRLAMRVTLFISVFSFGGLFMSFYGNKDLNTHEKQFVPNKNALEFRNKDLIQNQFDMDANKDIIESQNDNGDALHFKNEKDKDIREFDGRPVAPNNVLAKDELSVKNMLGVNDGRANRNLPPEQDNFGAKHDDVEQEKDEDKREEPDALAQIGAPKEQKKLGGDDSPGMVYLYDLCLFKIAFMHINLF